jgi:hypothetical protein
MRDQYAGDVSDVLKFGFLRSLAGSDRTLGIAWYYAPGDDGRPDGRHREWRDEQVWHRLDAQLCAGLSNLSEHSVSALERAAIWPKGTLFHREPMPTPLLRDAWGLRKRVALESANIVFLDPDNGLGTDPKKHATLSEIRLLRRPGRAIAFITFPKRQKHDVQVRALHEQLMGEAGAHNVITLRTNVSVLRDQRSAHFVQRARWFTVVDPDSDIVARAHAFAAALSSIPRVRARLDGVARVRS